MNPIEKPTVTVIVPNYNHAPYLEERLNSITGQTIQDFELIVLDDASTDDSVLTIKRNLAAHPYHLVVNPTNSGSTFVQWDRAIHLAKGELIWIAESDDVADCRFLEKMIGKFKDKSVGMAYCQSLAIDENSRITANLKGWTDYISPSLWQHDFTLDGTFFAVNYMAIKNVIPNASAVLFRRSLYVSPPSIKPDSKLAGDWLLWVTIMKGGSIAYVSEPLNRYRFHSSTVRRKQAHTYLGECSSITNWIYAQTQAWDNKGNLTLAREHLANLWFSIGLEPAAIHLWKKHKNAYSFLYKLHGPLLLFIILRRTPVSAWRITKPYRLFFSLGLKSLLKKAGRKPAQ